jgi:hypothetical protein
VVIIFAFLDLGKNISFSNSLIVLQHAKEFLAKGGKIKCDL